MADLSTRPFIVIYVVWHPDLPAGQALADAMFDHFRRDLFANVAGGTGISVIFRSAPAPGGPVPLDVDFDDAETSAVVVLLDEHLGGAPDWVRYVGELARRAEETGLRARVFPVAIDRKAYEVGGQIRELNYVRWDAWFGDAPEDRRRKLIARLTYEFCRLLRHYLAHLEHPDDLTDELGHYLKPVRIFLSHSKHDADGERIAKVIRAHLHGETDLADFFDVLNIPAGLPFAKVLEHYVRVSAVVAIHTDSYSSREWCRREIIEAKRANVPLVVANCITDVEERGFPYMGNVPVVRLEPNADHRIGRVIARLLDEVFKDFLWRCRVALARGRAAADVVFLPRPPELISLVGLAPVTGNIRLGGRIVYPDPPIGSEEAALFTAVAPGITLRSYTEWLAEDTA
jgi:hypothetical protein